ncbi:hypothetical protein SAMN04487943_101294 [Gracilibacillus orientalis]|uniref:Uncharacterized protein n=1 Tax=Gracilibacillus orientalis TaxID=334253 RepID=A0A1I4HBA4_9BACI|nr:hypothetical protein [Gracilibacillus orientalis]SFL38711.1 hypothetical protein SAMN04487943_101294 [Gracilibacillus orientalis]
MQVTVKEVFNLNEGLNHIVNKELPVGVAFKLQRITRVVNEEYKTAQNMRSKLVTKYKEKDLDNGRVQLKEDELEDFNRELEELLGQEVKINVEKIEISELGSIQATPKTLGLIHTILIESNEGGE